MTQKKTFLKIFGLTVKNILPPSLWYMNARREVIFMRIKASKLLAAVNKDPDALIFRYCDAGIQDDSQCVLENLHRMIMEK